MHKGFVDLEAFIPGIRAEVRYATAHNLTGRPLDGYLAPRAFASLTAAQALTRAFAAAQAHGFGMLIYDAYRPQKAVDSFVRWSREPEDGRTKAEFYPELDKTQLFPMGYIALKSGHTRGSTIDLTLTDASGAPVCMGTSFDRMSELSHHGADGLTPEATRNRELLKGIMEQAGFAPYENEWWHYRLQNEPYPDTFFDFDIV